MDILFFRIRRSVSRRLTPPRIFILSFALVILVGAILLRLPLAVSRAPLSFVDALFSSASAVCVTGLAVIDIGKDLSFAGQILTLVLFQIGGLGIITFPSRDGRSCRARSSTRRGATSS
ncbi:MAG: hypothetical protein NTY86_02430 [Deltaproteobacteria bacterium]|nr:hypothetical protein [Deltaproteobacteria bacterium]